MLTRIRIKWKIVSTRDKPSDYYRFMSFSSCQYHMVAPKTSLDEIQIDKCNDNSFFLMKGRNDATRDVTGP